jgi:hypothetical protein
MQDFCVANNILEDHERITYTFYLEGVPADCDLHTFIASLNKQSLESQIYVKGKDIAAFLAAVEDEDYLLASTYINEPRRTASKKGKPLSSSYSPFPPPSPSPPQKRTHTKKYTHTSPDLTLRKNETHVLVQGSDTYFYREHIKEIFGRRWDPAVRAWTFPRTNTQSVKGVYALLTELGVRGLRPVEEYLYVEEEEGYAQTRNTYPYRVGKEVEVELEKGLVVVDEGQEEELMAEGRGRAWEKEEEDTVMAVEEEAKLEEERSGREEKAAQEDQEEGEDMIVADGEMEEKKGNVLSRALRWLSKPFTRDGGSAQEDGP